MKNFETKYVKVSYNEVCNAVEIIWNGFANELQHKETIENALQILIDNHCENWLADQTNAKAVSPKILKWAQTEIIPKAILNGAKKVAFIISKDIFNQMFADSVKTYIQKSLNGEIQYFKDMESARNWFKS